ncbi:MAG: BamA/TamA family outer membrane protein [Candidatus Latescibacteria bacterium]|nr:BamA/TamA family outer membrane protein [Candidatus Latescibacterota bacterium]
MKRFVKYICIIHLLIQTGIVFAQQSVTNEIKQHSLPVTAVDIPLDSVVVAGVDSLLLIDMEEIILSKAGGILNNGLIDHDIGAISSYLHEQGWWSAITTADVDSTENEPVILKFSVNTGSRMYFGRFYSDMEDKTDTALSPDFSDQYGNPFTKETFEQVINDIVALYSENGYPDAGIKPLMTAYGDTVDVNLRIHAGERAYIDSIVVIGLTITKDYVVLRELNHIIGRPAGPDAANDALAALRRLDFMRQREAPSIDYTPEGVCLLIVNLEEKGQGSFDGVVGYQPSDGGEKGEIIGTFNLDLANMFGTGRSSKVRWEKLGEKTEDLELGYNEPRIFGLPYIVSGMFMQEEREVLGYTRTQFSTTIGRYIGRLHINTGFRYEKVSADSLNSSHASGIEINTVWDDIDNSDNPRSGIRYGASWSLLSKSYRFGAKENTSLDRVSFNFDHYIPTINRQTIALLVRYRRVTGDRDRIDSADRYWIGGAKSLRGYREQQFPAVKALWGTIEYRFLTGGTSRFFVFVDTGHLINYVKNTVDSTFDEKTLTRTGYGFGLRIQSRAGTLGFDYGLGQGDSPGQGKLHMRLTAEF